MTGQLSKTRRTIDFVALFQTLWRGKKTIAGICVWRFCVAPMKLSPLSPRYTSTASFIPPNLKNSSSMASALAGQLSCPRRGRSARERKDHQGELYSGILRNRSIRGLNLVKALRVSCKSTRSRKRVRRRQILNSNTAVFSGCEIFYRHGQRNRQECSARARSRQRLYGCSARDARAIGAWAIFAAACCSFGGATYSKEKDDLAGRC